MTADELAAAYLEAYFTMSDALVDAIANLKTVADDKKLTTSEQLAARSMMVDLEAQKLILAVKHNAFMARFDTAQPPSESTVKRAIDVAADLAATVAQDMLAVGRLELFIGLIDAFSQAVKQPTAGAKAAAAVQQVGAAAALAANKRTAAALKATTTAWLQRRMVAAAKPKSKAKSKAKT